MRRIIATNHKKLHPSLRRLVYTMDNRRRLGDDLRRAAVTAPGVQPDEQGNYPEEMLTPQAVHKRVFVMLKGEQLPSGAYANLNWTHLVGNIYSVNVPLEMIEGLGDLVEVESVDGGRRFAPFLNTSLAETRADQVHNAPAGQTSFTGDGVIVGIIDGGMDLTLDDFRNADGTTRVAFLWDQNLTPQGTESSPAKYIYGVEYNQATIDLALQAADPASIVRHLAPESLGASSHGTHVAGIAAGNGRSADSTFPANQYVGAAPEATIIFVQPNSSDQDSSFTDSVHVGEAIAYIYEKADELNMPCVINMSLGQNGGSHDGESTVEQAIDQWLTNAPGRAFVSAAGNEHVWRGHSSGTLSTSDSRILRWKAGGEIPWADAPFNGAPLPVGDIGDFSINEMEVWYSSRDVFRVRVTSPSAVQTDWITPGETDPSDDGNGIFIDSERFTTQNGESRIYIEVSPDPATSTVETGEWLVEIEALETREGRFDAFIERDFRRHRIQVPGQIFQNFFADQSFFMGTDFDPVMTLGTPATARRGITVANYNHVSQAPNNSSSRGPTRDGRSKPEVAAPGTFIFSSNSRGGETLPDGSKQPMRVDKSGTSMSAPHVAGIVAIMLERSPTLTAAQIQKILIASASPPPGVAVFDEAWGYGRVDAVQTIALIDGIDGIV